MKVNHSLDLLIIKDVVAKIGGIEGVQEMSTEQIEYTASGEMLRLEVASFPQVWLDRWLVKVITISGCQLY